MHQRLCAILFATALWTLPAFAADPALIDAPKKEGTVVWYTGLIVDQFVRPAAAAFEQKYGIKVDYVRADSVDVALRMFNEAKAGHPQSDVFDGFAAPGLKKQGLVAQWLPDAAKTLPKQFVDTE